jgi:prepilin-type N-terminal cleavage/methylation domain-containing protein
MKIKRRGFTLVEVLIVVVIIAILAALILPKLLSQTENGYIAEAQNMLGTMRRAQDTHCSLSECNGTYATAWGVMNIESPNMRNWTYTFGANGTNSATRVGRLSPAGEVWTITLAEDGQYTCGSYTPVVTGTNRKGCRA